MFMMFVRAVTSSVTGRSSNTKRREAKASKPHRVRTGASLVDDIAVDPFVAKPKKKKKTGGGGPRARCFCITVPSKDFTQEDGTGFKVPEDHRDFKYCVYQMENGEQTGYLHYQLYVELKSTQRITAVKKMFRIPSAHVEIRQGSRAEAREYCMKAETRVPPSVITYGNGQTALVSYGPFEYGKWTGQGHRSDLDIMGRMAGEGRRDREIFEAAPGSYMRYYKGVDRVRLLDVIDEPERVNPLFVFLFIGKPDTGKTHAVYSYAKEKGKKLWPVPIQSGGSKSMWFDGYRGQPYVLLDDFAGEMKLTQLLRLLDKYPVSVEVKGGHVWWCPDAIFITTNVHPKDWYDYSQRTDSMQALKRRFTAVVDFNNKDVDGNPKGMNMGDFWSSFDAIMPPTWKMNKFTKKGLPIWDHPLPFDDPPLRDITNRPEFNNHVSDLDKIDVDEEEVPLKKFKKQKLAPSLPIEPVERPASPPRDTDDCDGALHPEPDTPEELLLHNVPPPPDYPDSDYGSDMEGPGSPDPDTEVEEHGEDDEEGGDVRDGGPDQPSTDDDEYQPGVQDDEPDHHPSVNHQDVQQMCMNQDVRSRSPTF